jgi:hypothetical protein
MTTQANTYASQIGYSDMRAYEIIEFKSEKKAFVRRLTAKLKETFKPEFVTGGFFATCTNQWQQKYDYSQNTDNEVLAIRLHKDGQWRDSHRNRYILGENPCEFYDYNF